MNEFKEQLSQLSKEEKEVLLSIMREDGADYHIMPLSSQQRRMWYLYQMDSKNPYYNVTFMIHMIGRTSIDIVKKTISALLERNQILNSYIVYVDGEAFQYISDDVSCHLKVVKVRDVKEAGKVALHLHNTPFDLEEERPIRFSLCSTRKDESVLVVSMHHICVDGWSIGLLFEQFQRYYYRFSEAKDEMMEGPGFQYYDYTALERNDDQKSDITFWNNKLANANHYLKLPLDFPRPVQMDTQSASERFEFLWTDEAAKFCRENKISATAYFLGVYFLALRSWCRQENITVGMPVLNRESKKWEDVVGFFSNTIPISMQVPEQINRNDFFQQLNNELLEGIEHGAVPFDEIVEMQNIRRETNINPLFQTVFSMQSGGLTRQDRAENMHGIIMELLTLDTGEQVQFDLLCTVIEKENGYGYELTFDYKKSLFQTKSISKLLKLYQTIAEKVVTEQEQCSLELPQNWKKDNISNQALRDRMEDLRTLILEKNTDIPDCHVLYEHPVCVVFYIGDKVISSKWFRQVIGAHILAPVTSVRVFHLPLNEEGNVDEAYLLEKSALCFKDLEDAINKFKQNNPEIEFSIETKVYREEDKIFDTLKELGVDISDNKTVIEKEKTTITSVKEHKEKELSVLIGAEPEELKFKILPHLILDLEKENLSKKIIGINFGDKRRQFTYAQLQKDVKTAAANLQKNGVKKGDKIVLEINRADEFIKVFWGCVLAGAVVIPLDIPKDFQFEEGTAFTDRFINILKLTEYPLVIADEQLYKPLEKLKQIPDKKLRNASSLLRETKADYQLPHIEETDIALILFTSGSTGIPKGVQLSHRNILKRSQAAAKANCFHQNETSLNWMPLSHVGGIVMFHIQDVVIRAQIIQVETGEILRDPVKWLLLMDEYSVTNTWAPNFAYGLIVEQKDRISDLNFSLRELKFILNGGEAVNFTACHEFMMLLKEKGLRYSAMKPSWGMTETTSGVLFADDFGKTVYRNTVSVGRPVPGVKVRIVNDKGNPVLKGEIGNLHISGETVNQGYYKNPEENAQTFTEDGWFDTGDYAMIMNDGIVITGRAKDIVIVNGVNVSCLEIEKSLEQIEGLLSGSVACTSIRSENGVSDQVCIFFGEQQKEKREYLKEKIAQEMMENYGFTYEFLIPVKDDTIPRTSIGKIDKKKLLKEFQEGALKSITTDRNNQIPKWFTDTRYIRKEIRKYHSKNTTALIFGEGAHTITDIKAVEARQPVQNAIYKADVDSLDAVKEKAVFHMKNIRDILEEHREDLKHLIVLVQETALERDILQGYCTSLPTEYADLHVKVIIYQKWTDVLSFVNDEINDLDQMKNKVNVVKYVNGKRYLEVLECVDIKKIPVKRDPFEQKGQYIVIGGLGGIGTLITKFMLKKYHCRLIILGRSRLEQWAEAFDTLMELKELGSVTYETVDIRENGDLEKMLNKIYREYKNIDGIINLIGEDKSALHFADLTKYEMKYLTEERMSEIISPRLAAMMDIDRFLMDKSGMDVIAFSSATALFGGKTYCIYAGVSKYLYDFKLSNPNNTYSVFAWSKWNDIGMSQGETDLERIATESSGFWLIDETTGLGSMMALLARNCRRAVIGVDMKHEMIARYREIKEEMGELTTTIVYDGNAKIDGMVKQSEHESNGQAQNIEKTLLPIWKKVLGRGNIGINDRFFHIGGNSLKSMKLVAEINNAFGCEISIIDLFQYSTIKEIAGFINQAHAEEEMPDMIDI